MPNSWETRSYIQGQNQGVHVSRPNANSSAIKERGTALAYMLCFGPVLGSFVEDDVFFSVLFDIGGPKKF